MVSQVGDEVASCFFQEPGQDHSFLCFSDGAKILDTHKMEMRKITRKRERQN